MVQEFWIVQIKLVSWRLAEVAVQTEIVLMVPMVPMVLDRSCNFEVNIGRL
jgi:hypothetical protein